MQGKRRERGGLRVDEEQGGDTGDTEQMLLTTDAPDHLNLKERYTHTLRRLLKEKTPSCGRCGGIHRLLEESTARPVLIHRPRAGRTWVWSDLHLGDTEVMEYCRRRFGDADAMGRAIMAAWTAAVEPDDTILNGGDIALSSALGKTRRTAIREAPGAQAPGRRQPRLQPAVGSCSTPRATTRGPVSSSSRPTRRSS